MKPKRAGAWLILAALVLSPCAAYGAGAVPRPVLDARASLVRVFCRSDGADFGGTGFAVGETEPVHYIVTNHHVVAGENAKITVMCAGALSVGASVYLKNDCADLCVLRLDTPLYALPPLTIEDAAAPQVGDVVYALGFPSASDSLSSRIGSGVEDVTVTDGIVSARKTGALATDGPPVALIQTTAPISSGNSGGPLMNESGHAIGVNTLSVQGAQNINAAVDTQALRDLLDAGGLGYLAASTARDRLPPPVGAGWLCAGCAALALAGSCAAWLGRRRGAGRKGASFEAFFGDATKPLQQKLAAFLPVAERVRAQHALSRYSFDICPENIGVVRGRAALRLRRAALHGNGALAIRPGYSAPERYAAAGMIGPWTDVYAVCALVFRLMAGGAPAPAFERTDERALFPKPPPARLRALATAVTAGLCVDYRDRPPSLDALCKEIRAVGLRARETSALAVLAVKRRGVRESRAADKSRGGRAKRAVACVCGVLALLAGALCVCEINYAQAMRHTEGGAYAMASRSLGGVPAFYRDTERLSRYVQAGGLLEDGHYEQAETLFLAMGAYRDAPGMARAAAYREALQLLESGRLSRAQARFAALGDYEDARLLAAEAAYRQADESMRAGDLLEAKSAFAALHPYKDSGARQSELTRKIYEAAMTYLDGGEYAQAAAHFADVPGYRQADGYGGLCELLLLFESGGAGRADYQRLAGFAGQFDVSRFLLGDAVIRYFLEGEWEDGAGNSLALGPDGSLSSNLPWDDGRYYFRGAALFMRQPDGGDAEAFRFGYVDQNTILLHCCKNGRDYTLARQP